MRARQHKFTEPGPAGRRVRLTDEMLEQVASTYRSAFAQGKAPTKAVAASFGVSHSSAARWVGRARDEGYLEQTTAGRAGEVKPHARASREVARKLGWPMRKADEASVRMFGRPVAEVLAEWAPDPDATVVADGEATYTNRLKLAESVIAAQLEVDDFEARNEVPPAVPSFMRGMSEEQWRSVYSWAKSALLDATSSSA